MLSLRIIMHYINLVGEWVIKASRENIYGIISDFEKMPEYFPEVAESLEIIEKNGNNLKIDARVKSFGTIFPVKMNTTLLPLKGFISDNVNKKLGTFGHEEFLLEDDNEGTRIKYSYAIKIEKFWLRIIAKPLLEWYAMWFWEKVFINKLKKILETQKTDN